MSETPLRSSQAPSGRQRGAILPVLMFVALLSLLLGSAAAWPLESTAAARAALLYSLILFAFLGVFFCVLPRAAKLPTQIFFAMITGAVAGWLLDRAGYETFVSGYIGIFGALFILLLKMVVVPLVFTSIVSGLAEITDIHRVGRLGLKTAVYYLAAAMVATFIGLLVVNAIRPGVGKSSLLESLERENAQNGAEANFGHRIQKDFLPAVIPGANVSKVPVLPIIFGAIVLGLALAVNGTRAAPATKFFNAFNDAIMTVVAWIMYLAPAGVFALMASAVATMGLGYLLTLAKYVFTVMLGLGLHFCFLLFVVIGLLGRYSPKRFLRAMAPALQLGFSTSSSSATLPVSLECLTTRVGVSKTVAGFMLPIGATVNMNGTALYQAVAAVFIAQVYGTPLHLSSQLMIFLTAILVSIGSAGLPGASVGLMALVLASAGIPTEGIGLILGVDRFLDMCRTFINVLDDSACATFVARTEGEVRDDIEF